MPYYHWFAPTSQGDGSGTSRANAASYSHGKALAVMRQWKTLGTPAVLAPHPDGQPMTTGSTLSGKNPSATDLPVGGRILHGRKVITERRAEARIAGFIVLRTDLGNYVTPPDRTDPADSGDDCSGPAGGLGTTESPHLFWWFGAEGSNGAPMTDEGGAVWSKSMPVTQRAGTRADWENPANYTGRDNTWSGGKTTATFTLNITRPKPRTGITGWTGVTFVGTRTKDPRTEAQRETQQWVAPGTGTRLPYDPTNTTKANPIYLKDDGKTPYEVPNGGRFDMETREVIPSSGTRAGNEFWRGGASRIIFQGIRWINYSAVVDNSVDRPHSMIQFRDCASDNTKYWNVRGGNASHYWFKRVDIVAWSQKAINVEDKNVGWVLDDVWMDGAFVVGDAIKCAVQSIAPYDGGPTLVRNFFATCLWDALPVSKNSDGSYVLNKYFQGEAFDYETNNLHVENFFIDLCGDGAADTKARTRFVGYPSVCFYNGVAARCRRNFRLWPSAADLLDDARVRHSYSLLLDVSIQDSRQFGVYMPTKPEHHRIVEFDNTGKGWFMFENQRFPAGNLWEAFRHSEDTTTTAANGNVTVVTWNPADARPSTAKSLSAWTNTPVIHPGNKTGPALPAVSPFRRQLRTLLGAPPATPHLMNVDGAAHNPDTDLVAVGAHTLAPPGTGSHKSWRKGSADTGTLVVAGDKLSASYERTS